MSGPSRRWLAAAAVLAGTLGRISAAPAGAAAPRAPIIDVHLHAEHVADYGPTPAVCSDNRRIRWTGWDPRTPFSFPAEARGDAAQWTAPATDGGVMKETLAALQHYNIRGVIAGAPEDLASWIAAEPRRLIPAVNFFASGFDAAGRPRLRELGELRQLVADGRVRVFAEVTPQYRGMSPADPALDPYWSLAEELDVPVGLHMGEGPVGGPNVDGYSRYRVGAGSPLLLEAVLTRHPKLRLYVMHFGSPLVDEMIAMLFAYPQVYVDVAQNDWGFPRAHFYGQLRRLVDAGFGERILFGSDQMVWPQTIGLAVQTIESAPFLTQVQKRDILHDNAARFLRLDRK
jgi:uncharacterized protein